MLIPDLTQFQSCTQQPPPAYIYNEPLIKKPYREYLFLMPISFICLWTPLKHRKTPGNPISNLKVDIAYCVGRAAQNCLKKSLRIGDNRHFEKKIGKS